MNTEYSAYDLFMTCMHSNGIAFDVIKKALPVINTEIAKVLSNIVEFEVFFENSENKLNILIKHPKHDPRQLETCSGAEKTLAAVAIRIALLNVSNMPKSNLFILDEPGTALDAENMEGFVRILDLVKGYFDVTLLITQSITREDRMVAVVKAFADKHLERFVSKKLLVWLTTTGLLLAEKVDSEQWIIIATAYVGTQGFVDVVARFKGK